MVQNENLKVHKWIFVIFKKPSWVGDFGTVIINLKLFHFRHDFEVFFSENVELVHAEHALGIFFF
jgi:hypothetical protein